MKFFTLVTIAFAASSLNDPCGTCKSGLKCEKGVCKAMLDSACDKGTDCVSNFCARKCYKPKSVDYGGKCFTHHQCIKGRCRGGVCH